MVILEKDDYEMYITSSKNTRKTEQVALNVV